MYIYIYMRVSIAMVVPPNGCLIFMENSNLEWMMTGVNSISANHHLSPKGGESNLRFPHFVAEASFFP